MPTRLTPRLLPPHSSLLSSLVASPHCRRYSMRLSLSSSFQQQIQISTSHPVPFMGSHTKERPRKSSSGQIVAESPSQHWDSPSASVSWLTLVLILHHTPSSATSLTSSPCSDY